VIAQRQAEARDDLVTTLLQEGEGRLIRHELGVAQAVEEVIRVNPTVT
jgi:hypothetical protein